MFRTSLRTAGQRCYVNPVGPTGMRGALSSPSSQSRSVGGFATRHENDPQKIEKGKREVLDGQDPKTTSKAEWHEGLASDSEAFVKAIRSEVKDGEKELASLAKASEEVMKKQRKDEEQQTGRN